MDENVLTHWNVIVGSIIFSLLEAIVSRCQRSTKVILFFSFSRLNFILLLCALAFAFTTKTSVQFSVLAYVFVLRSIQLVRDACAHTRTNY